MTPAEAIKAQAVAEATRKFNLGLSEERRRAERRTRAAGGGRRVGEREHVRPRVCYDGCKDHLYHTPIADGWYEVYSVSDGMCGHIEIENLDPASERYSGHTSFHWSVMSKRCDSQHAARQAAREWIAAGCPDDDVVVRVLEDSRAGRAARDR